MSCPQTLAAAAFFLASKVEEHPRRLRDVVGATLDLDAGKIIRGGERFAPPDEQTPDYVEMRKRILFFEEVLLRTLCFDLTVRQPYWPMVRGAKMIWKDERVETGHKVSKVAWCFISDSYVFVRGRARGRQGSKLIRFQPQATDYCLSHPSPQCHRGSGHRTRVCSARDPPAWPTRAHPGSVARARAGGGRGEGGGGILAGGLRRYDRRG